MIALENSYSDLYRLSNSFWTNTEQILNPTNQKVPVILIESMDYDTQILLTTLLNFWNFEVVESTNFENSMTLIETENPAVILFDCLNSLGANVEEITGFKKNKLSHKIPIIAFSEFAEVDYQNQLLAAGAEEYLLKPINFAQLETLIHHNIEKYHKFSFNFGGLL
jgi:DNA-binding response OmpR family regulator